MRALVAVVVVVSAGIAHADTAADVARSAARLDYAAAAARLEADARKHPAGAADALTNALAFRAAAGDDKRAAIDGEAAFRAARAMGDRDGAAVIARSLVAVYGRLGKDTPAVLDRALALTADSELDQRAFLAAKRAAQLWAASCPVPLWEGLCVKVDRVAPELLPNFVAAAAPAVGARCPGARLRLVPVARKKPLVDAAFAQLIRVEGLIDFDRLAAEGVTRDVSFAVATAMLYQADQRLEDALRATAPVDDLAELRTHEAIDLRNVYAFPLHAANAQLEIAAAFRLALVPQVLGDDVAGAIVPAGEAPDAFCASRAREAAPLRAAARATYDQCLKTAGEGAVLGPWTTACVRERAQLDVLATPPLLESLPPFAYELPEPVAEPPPALRADAPATVAEARAAFDAADRTGWNAAACSTVPTTLAAIANTQPDELDYQELAGLAAEHCHRWEPALRFYDRAAEHGSVAAQLDRATVQWILGDRATALATWRSIAAGDPSRFGAQFGLALAGLDGVLAHAPLPAKDAATVRTQIAVAKGLAKTRDARAAAAGAAGILAASIAPAQRGAAAYELEDVADDAHALQTRPWLWVALGAFERDTGRFERVAAEVPDDLVAQYDRALSLLAVGAGKAAEPLLARAAALGSIYDRAVAAGVLARQLGRFEVARKAYEEAILADDARPEAHEDLAILLAYVLAPRARTALEAAADLDNAALQFRAAGDVARAKRSLAERTQLPYQSLQPGELDSPSRGPASP
ncbi:MAG TPA: hypothetical protein VGM88_13835 [Kofleriaceae bacterium]|jgi:hypothetical protein